MANFVTVVEMEYHGRVYSIGYDPSKGAGVKRLFVMEDDPDSLWGYWITDTDFLSTGYIIGRKKAVAACRAIGEVIAAAQRSEPQYIFNERYGTREKILQAASRVLGCRPTEELVGDSGAESYYG